MRENTIEEKIGELLNNFSSSKKQQGYYDGQGMKSEEQESKELADKYYKEIIQSLLDIRRQALEEVMDDLWEQAQKDSKGFGKAYSYLVVKYKPEVLAKLKAI